MKQLLPERTRIPSAVKAFIDEIRLCATLDQPTIVLLIGISWSSIQDLSVVIQYMAWGDVCRISMSKSVGRLSPSDWFEPTPILEAKRQVALVVVQAIVYLHSFESPIILCDLMARNVLASGDGDAKLSDFGICREMSIEETMTSKIGTVAWIAPEVLCGEQYSEKADIYLFGALRWSWSLVGIHVRAVVAPSEIATRQRVDRILASR